MKLLIVTGLVSVLVATPLIAHADERVPKGGSIHAYLSRVRHAAVHQDVTALRRLTSREFTIGEELDRPESLAELRAHPGRILALVQLVDHGACNRTGPGLVQCELPDPGNELDHGRGDGRGTTAIFEHTRRGWKMNLFSAP